MFKLYKKLILLVIIVIPLVAIITPKASASIQSFVETKANVLSSDEIYQLNLDLNTFAQSTINDEAANSQFAVKIIDSTNNESIEDYSRDLFNNMQIGDKTHNLGILLVVALDDHKFRIQLGDGWRNTNLNENYIESYVFTDTVESEFRDGNYYKGINSIVKSTMELAGSTVKIPTSLNINSDEMNNNIKNDQKIAVILILLIIVFAIISSILLVSNKIKRNIINKGSNQIQIKVKNLLLHNDQKLKNYPDADIQMINSLPVKRSLKILQHYNVEELAEEYTNIYLYDNINIVSILFKRLQYKPLKSLDTYLNYKAEDELLIKKKAKDIQEIKQLMMEYPGKWALSIDTLADCFIKTELPITIKNLRMFSNNIKANKKILAKQKNASDYNINEQAINLTIKHPSTIYDQSLLSNLAAYSLLSNNYRSDSWWDSQDSQDSSSSSSFSDFGGGGFSSGDGASGGW